VLRYIFLDRGLAIVDKRRTEAFDDCLMPGRTGGKHLGTEGAGYLHRHMPHTTRTAMNQHLLPRTHPRPVH